MAKASAQANEKGPGAGAPAQPAAAFRLLAGVLVAVPLALTPGLHYFDLTPKLMVLVLGAAAVWLALTRKGRLPSLRGDGCWFFRALAALAVCGILATVFSRDPVISLAGSEWRRLGLPAWLACLALAGAIPVCIGGSAERRRQIAGAMALAGVAAAIYSFFQYLGLDPWINPALYHIGEGEWQIVRPPGTLGYVSYFGVFLVPALFGAAALAFSAHGTPGRLGWAAAGSVLATALVITGSRGAWLGATAGALVLLARIKQRKPLLLGLLAIALLAGALVASPAGQRIRSRIRWFVEDPAGGSRALLWRDSVRLGLGYPLLGAGLDTFELAFPAYQSLELAERFPDRYAESPHNVFLDYWTAAGLPAMLAFALLMGVAVRNYALASRSSPLDAALFAGLAGGLVAAQFVADTIPTRLALLAFAALSVSSPRLRPGRAAPAATVAAAMAFLAAVVFFGFRLLRADRALFAATQAASAGNFDLLLQLRGETRPAAPWTSGFAFAYSRLAAQPMMNPVLPPAQRGLLAAVAEDAARASLPHSARPQMVHVQLASLYVLQGRAAEAEAALRAAARAAPAWYRPRWLLAALLSSQARNREAAEEAAAALQRGAGRHPQIAAQCREIRRLGGE